MGYTIRFDWMEEFKERFDNWENKTEYLVRGNCKHYNQDKNNNNIDYSGYCEECEVYENSFQPMMNYAYPLEIEPKDEDIIKCWKETGLIVMYNTEQDEHYLVLTGGGMDLSQQIARAYIICQRWIPHDLMINVSSQKGLNVGGEEFEKLRKEMIYQFENTRDNCERKIKEWSERK